MRMLLYIFILFPIITLAETTAKDTIEWLNGFINTVNWKVEDKDGNLRIEYEDYNNNKFSYYKQSLTHKYTMYTWHIDLLEDKGYTLDKEKEEEKIDLSRVVKFYKEEETSHRTGFTYKHYTIYYYSICYRYKKNDGSYSDATLISTQYNKAKEIKRIINALNHLVKIAGGGEKEPF